MDRSQKKTSDKMAAGNEGYDVSERRHRRYMHMQTLDGNVSVV
jgi:hypothetical protein